MKHSDIVAKLAEENEVSKAKVDGILKGYREIVLEEVKKGETVSFPKFLTFSSAVREARTGRNPQTGETIELPEKTVPKVKAAKAFKDIFLED